MSAMAHEFELVEEISLDATPEEVWAAIATGPGVDSWFMGRTEIEPGVGGRNRTEIMGFGQESTTTAWAEGKHYAYRGDESPDGRFMAFEYLIEGRAGGSTVLRLAHSGMLGDDWEREYDGLRTGNRMYLLKLRSYLAHFAGRAVGNTSSYTMFLVGPVVEDPATAWAGLTGAFGVRGPIAEGDRITLAVPGIAGTEGSVDFVNEPNYLGVRTADGIYALIHGYNGAVVFEYHSFNPAADGAAIERAWLGYIADTFGAESGA
jgi:Activator of Hsp90 ATPase homolog 1-like protein